MAIILPGGFNITNNEPVDARVSLADETTRYALSSANVYEGLIVFQQDNNTIWVLTDTSNVANSNGWTQIQIGSVDSNLPSGVVSGSEQVLGGTGILSSSNENFTDFSSSVDDRLDQLSTVSGSQDDRLDNLELFSSSQESKDSTLETYTSSIDTKFITLASYTGSNDTTNTTQNSRLDQLSTETGSIASEQSVQDDRLSQIEAVTGSLSGLYEEKSSATHTLVSGSSQVNFTQLSGISSNIISASSDTAQVDMIINGGSISANLKGGVVSGSAQVTSSLDSRYVNLTGDETVGGNKTFSNNIVITGNLTVNGTTTSVNSNTVNIGDNIIVLNSDVTGTPTQNGGIEIERGSSTNASITWDEGTTSWKAGLTGAEVEIVTTSGTQTLTNKTIAASQVTEISNLTAAEGEQLENINTTTISTTQWGYVGELNQGLTQTSDVKFGIISGSSIHSTGDVFAKGDVVAYASSDIRLKDDIQPIENSLEKINQISGYSFVWNDKQNIYNGKDYGVIAQEIEQILPELVENREDGYKAVKYDRLVSLLIEGIKDLSQQVEELKEKINKG